VEWSVEVASVGLNDVALPEALLMAKRASSPSSFIEKQLFLTQSC